jgi:PHD/YefM family antitoxin component YafN of YafNO toxin-antitoxin module
MSRSTYSVTQAQSQLSRLLRQAERGALVGIRRRDQTVAYLLSRDYLEALIETMELLDNPAARRAIADHRAGKTRFAPLSALDRDE